MPVPLDTMKMYQLRASQFLPTGMEEAWAFLSDPKNLERITPGQMGFRIVSGADRPMFPGQIIQYRLYPFPGISTSWVTEITHVENGVYFVDEQRFGPYALWHHKHFLTPAEGGVIMEDVVDYCLPFGLLGQWAHRILVKKQLRAIFRYRAERLRAFFGTKGHERESLQLLAL